MTTEPLRLAFEVAFPPPDGVTFDGDHYQGTHAVPGSFRNATAWADMYRGWAGHANQSRKQEEVTQ